MTTKLEMVPPADDETQHRLQLTDAIGRRVLQALGRPHDLQQVQVRRLWENHYRVNVFVGDAGAARVAKSYFLVADGDGAILTASPTITKQY